MIEYHSIQNILDLCKEQDKKIWEVVLQADMDESGASGEQVFEKMRSKLKKIYKPLKEVQETYAEQIKDAEAALGVLQDRIMKQHDLYSWSATRLKLSHEAMTDYGILNAAAHKLEEL